MPNNEALEELYNQLCNLQMQLGSSYVGDQTLKDRLESAGSNEAFSKSLDHNPATNSRDMIQRLPRGIASEGKEDAINKRKIQDAVIYYTQSTLGKGKRRITKHRRR